MLIDTKEAMWQVVEGLDGEIDSVLPLIAVEVVLSTSRFALR
jgi:hypothetical protein